MPDARQHFGGEAAGLGEVFPMTTREMNEFDSLDCAASENIRRYPQFEVYEFADEEIERFTKQRQEMKTRSMGWHVAVKLPMNTAGCCPA